MFELDAKLRGDRGPLSEGNILLSIGVVIALTVGAPLVLLFAIVHFLRKIISRISKRPVAFDDYPSRESVLVEMIEQRRRKDSRLRRLGQPNSWPMSQLWKMPEAVLLDMAEDFAWLRDAKLDDQSALLHLERIDGKTSDSSQRKITSLHELVTRKLSAIDPTYVVSDSEVITKQVQVAERWAREEIQRIKSERPYPPREWLTERVTLADIGDVRSLSHRKWSSVIKARATERDELWRFSSPADQWQNLAGRAGFALVREGRPIDHVVTLMN